MPRLPPYIPSILIQTTLLFIIDPDDVTNLAYLEASKIPTPPFPAPLGLSHFYILAQPLGSNPYSTTLASC